MVGSILSDTVLFDNREDAKKYGDARVIAEEIAAGKMMDDFLESVIAKITGAILK